MTRDEEGELIRTHGGKVSSSMSKNIDHVVDWADPGYKYDKARELNVVVMSEKKFGRCR